jgi:hypothetical protein
MGRFPILQRSHILQSSDIDESAKTVLRGRICSPPRWNLETLVDLTVAIAGSAGEHGGRRWVGVVRTYEAAAFAFGDDDEFEV